MNSLFLKKERILACVLGVYIVYYLMIYLSLAWGFTVDDAYISWYYARQMVEGNGFYWNDHLPLVEGYSNFLWVMISALVLKLHLPLVITIKWISIFCLGAGLFFLYGPFKCEVQQ